LKAWCHWVVFVGLAACSSAPNREACDAAGTCSASQARGGGAGLRVALSSSAKSVCVRDQGCAEGPKGAIRIRPLEAPFREAIAEALAAVGFEVVDVTSERDLVADVEWRGTDTIALRLQDAHGRVIDQASFSRSLERCRELPDLTWDSCWAANFTGMKQALARPLEQSAALLAFARKTKGALPTAQPATAASTLETTPRSSVASVSPGATADRLDAGQLHETVARYRKDIERSCWLPALEARDVGAPTSARISTSVTIHASGNVEDVTTTGDPPGYLHLARCIATQVRSWRFPSAKRSTTASIPFVFAGD
jgi:hypothetical protein